ncbi:MAG: hypothetical protein IJ025_03290 [Clostridia bacterium]|nr:hypothetical protein [Clostridia bacterium]
MEFNRYFNFFTVSAIVILLVTALAAASFAVVSRAESNLGTVSSYENEKNNQLTEPIF